MANAIKWSALGTNTTVINGDASAPTLKNLANNAQKLGSAVSNQTDRNQYAIMELLVRGAVAFSAGGYVSLYIIQADDDTNYQDGDDSVAPPETALAGIFPVRAVSTAQRVCLPPIVLPACLFKFLIINKGGQAFTNTDNENILKMRTFNNELQ